VKSEHATRTDNRTGRKSAPPFQIPRTLAVAAMLISGIWVCDALAWTALWPITLTAFCLFASVLAARYRWSIAETVSLSLAVFGLGASLWAVRNLAEDGRNIGQLAAEKKIDPDTAIRLTGIVSNIPALDSVADATPQVSSRPIQPRTLFLLKANSVTTETAVIAVRGTCRVLINGDATGLLKWGDCVELTGHIDPATPPLNPGEFDFARHLQRSRISIMMFVKHPAAARVLQSEWWSSRALLTSFRQQTVFLLKNHLSPVNRSTAEALLLGNRGHLAPDLERDFIASGTMHLLAISGLHVGILYVFIVRILNVLLVPRTRALILAGTVCVLYCLLTDLRPSVMRATAFIVLNILGQILCRDLKMGTLIGTATLLLVIVDPAIVFNVGAWLSFLAVGALGWVSDQQPPAAERAAPPDASTWWDQLRDVWTSMLSKLKIAYRQMLAVTVLSAPLVATQFHTVSLTGMLINVILIPLTAITLISGYIFIAVGLAFPPIAFLPGLLFEFMLWLMNTSVVWAADLRSGFITIPDLPAWFLPAYYLLLAVSAVAGHAIVRQTCRLSLLTLVVVLLWSARQPPVSSDLVCTILSVGHGNAVVVETPEGKIFLFDAGALNRGERTADLISHFLWKKGHRMIDAIVISHPDMDHYNAVASLLDRMPVGQVLLTEEFARSKAAEVQHVLAVISSLKVPCEIVMHGDTISANGLTIDFLKANLTDSRQVADNAASLVAVLNFANRRICLPGDLEGDGQTKLLAILPECDLLMSPHHGSTFANKKILAATVRPKYVVVSARNDKLLGILKPVYAESDVRMTSRTGAVSYRIAPDGKDSIESFVQNPRMR